MKQILKKYKDRLSVACLLICAAGVSPADPGRLVDPKTPSAAGPPGSRLVFSDEFEGGEIDKQKWHLGINPDNIQNDSVDCAFRWENISLRDGNLVFIQRREPAPVSGKVYGKKGSEALFDYSSGGMNTGDSFLLRNNMYVEIRVKLPDNDGGFAAFWTMPQGNNDRLPEDLLEIDLFEFMASRNKTKFWSGLWWHNLRKSEIPDSLPEAKAIKRTADNFFLTDQDFKPKFPEDGVVPADQYKFYDFITFGFSVSTNTMKWYVCQKESPWKAPPYMVFEGGTVQNRRRYSKAPPLEWQRQVPQNLGERIILNYDLRNEAWCGGPVRDKQLPAEMQIDYIRVYELTTEGMGK